MPWAPTTAQRDLLFVAVGLSGRQETPHCRRISLQQRSPPTLTLVLLLLVLVSIVLSRKGIEYSSSTSRPSTVLLLCYEIYCQRWFSPEKRTGPAPVPLSPSAHLTRSNSHVSASSSLSSRKNQHGPTLYTQRSSLRPRDPASDRATAIPI